MHKNLDSVYGNKCIYKSKSKFKSLSGKNILLLINSIYFDIEMNLLLYFYNLKIC